MLDPDHLIPALSMIVAASDNNVIGVDGDLPWRLSADLKRFKSLTMGHAILMGRKTYQSIGRLLPGRTTVIITRNPDFEIEGARVARSIDEAIAACGDDATPFLTGGAEIYRLGLSRVTRLFLTRVHVELEGDTHLPPIDWDAWELVQEEHFPADERNDHPYSFLEYRRR